MAQKPTLYLFYGDNSFDLARELRRWVAAFTEKHGAMNILTVNGNEAETLPKMRGLLHQALHGSALFGNTKLIILKNVVTEKTEHAPFLEEIASLLNAAPKGLFVVIAQYEKTNHAFVKKIEALAKKGKVSIKAFPLPSESALTEWVRRYAKERGATMEPAAVKKLLALLPAKRRLRGGEEKHDLWRLANEIDKLASYAYPKKTISEEDVKALVAPDDEVEVWGLTDALMCGDGKRAAELLERRLSNTPATAQDGELRFIMSILSNQVKKLLVVKNAGSNLGNVAAEAGWSRWHLAMLTRRASRVDTETLNLFQKKLLRLYEFSLEDQKLLKRAFFATLA